MHYTPKVPKNNCQFQNKSMLSWETAFVSALTSRRLRRAVQVAEARRVASSALLQSTPLHRRHASHTTKHELPRTHSTRLICLQHVLQLSLRWLGSNQLHRCKKSKTVHTLTSTNIPFVDNHRHTTLKNCSSRNVAVIPVIVGSNPAQRMTFKQSYVTVTPFYN